MVMQYFIVLLFFMIDINVMYIFWYVDIFYSFKKENGGMSVDIFYSFYLGFFKIFY